MRRVNYQDTLWVKGKKFELTLFYSATLPLAILPFRYATARDSTIPLRYRSRFYHSATLPLAMSSFHFIKLKCFYLSSHIIY